MRSILQGRQGQTRTLYLIGDDGCDKSTFFHFLQLEQEELNQQINVYVKLGAASSASAIEIYDFPTDRMVRSAMGLYFNLLPPASSLLYFMKDGASEKDICEWIRVLNDSQVQAKVVFISDVTTYLEREKILTRLAREFQAVLDVTFFVKLEPYAFRTNFHKLEQHGVTVDRANCLKPTIGRRFLQFFDKIIRRIKKRRNFLSTSQAQSVV